MLIIRYADEGRTTIGMLAYVSSRRWLGKAIGGVTDYPGKAAWTEVWENDELVADFDGDLRPDEVAERLQSFERMMQYTK